MKKNNKQETSNPLKSPSLGDNPQNANKSPQNKLPSWAKFHLKTFAKGVRYCASVIMKHYLIVLVQPRKMPIDQRRKTKSEDSASLLAFNLQDYTVQEAEIDTDLFFADEENYSFTRYGENQILKYYGGIESAQSFVCITVKSFQPFKVRCDKFEASTGKLDGNTAQIYKDHLYVYGRSGWDKYEENELWSFDLKNHAWKFWITSGEEPYPTKSFKSFLSQDSLVVFGGERDQADLFSLNLNSMKWTKVEQEKHLGGNEHYNEPRYGGVLYKNYLLTLKNSLNRKDNTLCSLNLRSAKKSWSTFGIKGLDSFKSVNTNSLMVYNGLLLACATHENGATGHEDLIVAALNLEDFGICAPKSAEDKRISSMFMKETESDIAFSIEEKTIPAHKRVLVKKSQYFEHVFKSGMGIAESNQKFIQIKNCKYELFKEYLRFIYQEKVDFGDIDQTIKLYRLADKYLQRSLQEKCLTSLIFKINTDTVYTVLDFAHQEDLPHIKDMCLRLFEDNLKVENIAGLITSLLAGEKDHQAFKKNNKELIEKALTFIISKFLKIYENEKEKLKLYEDFLIGNIEMDTIVPFAKFLSGLRKLPQEKCIAHLKESIFCFVQENIEIIMGSTMAKDFPNGFLVDFTLYQARNPLKQISNNRKKRMEPSKNDDNEENPTLKRIKKTDPGMEIETKDWR